VTVIATGFHHRGTRPSTARDAVRSRRRDRDVTLDDRQRSSLEISEDEIDIPPFLRDS
jgi:cell division protein FtsZ